MLHWNWSEYGLFVFVSQKQSKKLLKKLQNKLLFEPTTTHNTLFVFPQQKFQHPFQPLSFLSFTKKMLWKTLYKNHAQVNMQTLSRSWKNTVASTLFSNVVHPIPLQPYTVNDYFCYLVSLAHLLSLNTLAPEASCCVFYALCCYVHWRSETEDVALTKKLVRFYRELVAS